MAGSLAPVPPGHYFQIGVGVVPGNKPKPILGKSSIIMDGNRFGIGALIGTNIPADGNRFRIGTQVDIPSTPAQIAEKKKTSEETSKYVMYGIGALVLLCLLY